MSVSWKIVAATQFTAYMAMLNLSYSGGTMLAGTIEGWGLDYWQVFLLAAAVQVLVLPVLPFCSPSPESGLAVLDDPPPSGDS